MKNYLLLTSVLVLSLVSPECGKQGGGTPSLPPAQAAEARRAIVSYLECDECEAKEIEAVVKLGQVAVPTLAATLHEGAPRTSLEVYRRHLTAKYRELKEYERTHPEAKVPGTEQQYVASYLDRYLASYRVRAAIALGAIATPDAKRALEQASRMSLGKDVETAVKTSLQKIK